MKMKWNHRVLKEDDVVRVIECYYDKYFEPIAYCEATALSDTLEGLQKEIRRFKKATKQPILTPEDFKQGEQHEPEA